MISKRLSITKTRHETDFIIHNMLPTMINTIQLPKQMKEYSISTLRQLLAYMQLTSIVHELDNSTMVLETINYETKECLTYWINVRRYTDEQQSYVVEFILKDAITGLHLKSHTVYELQLFSDAQDLIFTFLCDKIGMKNDTSFFD